MRAHTNPHHRAQQKAAQQKAASSMCPSVGRARTSPPPPPPKAPLASELSRAVWTGGAPHTASHGTMAPVKAKSKAQKEANNVNDRQRQYSTLLLARMRRELPAARLLRAGNGGGPDSTAAGRVHALSCFESWLPHAAGASIPHDRIQQPPPSGSISAGLDRAGRDRTPARSFSVAEAEADQAGGARGPPAVRSIECVCIGCRGSRG